MIDIDRISGDVLNLTLRMHRELGLGLLESVYEIILAAKLVAMVYSVKRQRAIDIEYDGLRFDGAFRIDLLVSGALVEIKSVERSNAAHAKQLLTYLRLTHQPVGLFINFGGATLKEGVKRIMSPPRLRASA